MTTKIKFNINHLPKSPALWMISILLATLATSGCGAEGFGATSGWSAPVVKDDVVYVGSRDSELLALDRETGNVMWKFPSDDSIELQGLYGSPAFTEDLIFVGSYGKQFGTLYAVDNETYQKKWDFASDGHIVGSPVVIKGSVIFGSSSGTLYSVDISSGAEKWRFQTENKIWSTPAISEDIVFVSSLDKNIYALNLEEGKLIWKFETSGAVASTPLVIDGVVYVGSFDRYFYAIDATTGNSIWSSPFKGNNWFWGKAIADGTAIYAPSVDGNLYALNKYNGSPLWKTPFDTMGPIVSDPALVPEGIVVANDNGDVYLVNRSGQSIRSYSIKEPVRAPVTSYDSVAYISAMNHTVRAVDLDRGFWNEIWCYNTKESTDCD